MTEAELLHDMRLELGQLPGVVVWRNNVGVAKYPGRAGVPYGLCRGASDIIGLRSVVITTDHVGQTLAQFVAVEVKTATGRLSLEQDMFLKLVHSKGGLAICARDITEARAALKT
jgi:hypothetical protein